MNEMQERRTVDGLILRELANVWGFMAHRALEHRNAIDALVSTQRAIACTLAAHVIDNPPRMRLRDFLDWRK